MDDIHRRFSDKFRSHWIKVKFYKDKPKDVDAKRLMNVRFCEATRESILYPILLDKESISCLGAQHAFGWTLYKNRLLQGCYDKRNVQRDTLKSMLSRIPYFKKPFKYIGLNTEGAPDILVAYITPQEVMELIKIYNNKEGGNLDVSLCTMMAVCGSVAVRTYLEDKISLSFGCDDSRKYADMRRESLAIGIPSRLFKLFVD